MLGIEVENKKFPSNDITNPKIYATRMYKYEYINIVFIPLKTVRGDYAPAQALSMKTMSSPTSGSCSRTAR